MKNSLEKRILIFSLLALTLTITVNSGFNVASFYHSYREGILRRCETHANGFKRQIESVLKRGLPIADIDGLSERCEEIVRDDPEISYCLIESAQGVIMYHSSPPYPEKAESEFVERLSTDASILRTQILGEVYDFAVPLYNYEDKLSGLIRIGFQKKVLTTLTVDHLVSSLAILAAAFLTVFSIIVLFARFNLVLPIKRLCGVATEVSSGNFDVDVPQLKTSELALLGDALGDMARSLRERDQEIRRNYQELEDTNRELQISYENLESMSSELGRSREMYRSLLDGASDAILVCDADDKLVMANQAAERFFGLPKERMEGHNYFSFLEMIRCNDIEYHFEQYQLTQSGKSIRSEIRFWRALDQRQLLGWATSSAIVGKDKKRLVQVIVRDATHEEEVRHNLEKTAQEMARLNQMKNSFLGLASHELKTPLTIIMGYVELLQTEMADRLDDGTKEMVNHISRASERLSEIIRDMVEVSMLDGRSIDLVSQPVDINTLIKRALDKVQPYVKQRKQILHFELSNDLPPVKCDHERIVQAVSNILGNAIKFTPDHGHVTVKTRLVERSRLPRKFSQNGYEGACLLSGASFPYVEISVADTGIGIAEIDQDAIFDKFYEIGEVEEHSSGKIAFKSRGAGLGLTIVNGIVALHGGAVWVESPGYDAEALPGSTFYILLPVTEDYP